MSSNNPIMMNTWEFDDTKSFENTNIDTYCKNPNNDNADFCNAYNNLILINIKIDELLIVRGDIESLKQELKEINKSRNELFRQNDMLDRQNAQYKNSMKFYNDDLFQTVKNKLGITDKKNDLKTHKSLWDQYDRRWQNLYQKYGVLRAREKYLVGQIAALQQKTA